MTFAAIIAAVETTTDLNALNARVIEALRAKTITGREFITARRAIDGEKMTRFQDSMDAHNANAALAALGS